MLCLSGFLVHTPHAQTVASISLDVARGILCQRFASVRFDTMVVRVLAAESVMEPLRLTVSAAPLVGERCISYEVPGSRQRESQGSVH